jgi:carotenoid 9,10(9',10')-cleavage dioxygenase 1
MPYALRVLADGELETVGRVLFEKNYDERLSAHPKIHPSTGELFSVSYSFDNGQSPVTVVVIDKSGVLSRTINVSLSRRPMIHDCAITERFVIVMDLPLVFKPESSALACSLYINLHTAVRTVQHCRFSLTQFACSLISFFRIVVPL